MNAKMLSLTLAAGALMVQLTAAEQPAAAPAEVKPAAPAAEKPAQTAEQPDLWGFLPPVIARVNGKDITKQEFVDVMNAQLKGPDGKIPPMITAELLERVAPMQVKAFVDQKLLLEAAEKAGFKPSAELVKNTMKEQLDSMPKEQREMVKLQLQMTGKNEDAYIDEMAKNPTIQESFAIERYLDKTVVSKITVTDAEAKAYYDANIARFKEPADPANTIRASHILISTPDKATKEQLDAAKAKAEAILADLKKNPAGFEAAAKENSDCPSKENGGSLGAFGKGQMVKEFEEAAFALKEGELSGLVKTQFGYHIIRRDTAQPEKTIPFEEVKDRLLEGLKGQKAQAEVEKMLAELEAANKAEFLVKAPAPAPTPAEATK